MKLPRTLNPVFARELRQRMRGPRAAIILILYLLVLVFIVQIVYFAASGGANRGAPSIETLAGVGRSVFHTLVFFVLGLVCFIVPGVTASAVAGERERQTLVPLQITLLRPWSILVGKLMASLAFVVLLIVATLPLAAVSFLLGGVEPIEVIRATAMVLVVAVTLACVSLWCSTFFKRTQGATVVALALVFLLCVGTFIAFGAQMILQRGQVQGRSQLLLVANPFMAVADVLDRRDEQLSASGASPFTPMQLLLEQRRERQRDSSTWSTDSGSGSGPGGSGPVVVPPRPTATVVVAPTTSGPPQPDAVPQPAVPQPAVPETVIRDVRPAPSNPILADRTAAAGFEPGVPWLSRVPFWVLSLLAFTVLSVGSLALAARRLALPKPTFS